MNKIVLFIFVNLPIFSYLTQSFFDGKDVNGAYTFQFSILLYLLYFMQFLILFYTTRNNFYRGNLAYLYFLLAFTFCLGIIFAEMKQVPLLMAINTSTYLLLFQYLFSKKLIVLQEIVYSGLKYSIIGTVLFASVHYFASSGDFLFTLCQIQLPFIILIYLLLLKTMTLTRLQSIYLALLLLIFFYVLYLGGKRADLLNQFRLQFLPIAQTVLIVFLFSPRVIKYLVFIPIIYASFTNYTYLVGIAAYRLGSFDERISIIKAMALEGGNFFLPLGLGSTFKQYDISSLTEYSQSTRSLYPPHSGMAVILAEYSIFGIIVIALFIINYVTRHLRYEKDNLPVNLHGVRAKHGAGALILILLTVWFMENLFYLKAVITGATFSDDFLFLFLASLIYLVKIRFSERLSNANRYHSAKSS